MKGLHRIAAVAVAAFLLLLAADLRAEQLAWVKVTGRWTGERLEGEPASRRREDQNRGEAGIVGTIDGVGASGFRIGPMVVEWGPETRFRRGGFADLTIGRVVKVIGRPLGPGRLEALEVEKASTAAGEIQIWGTVERSDGSRRMTVLGVEVEIAGTTPERIEQLVRRPDERRPAEQLSVAVLDRPLTIGGEVKTELRNRSDHQLRRGAEDDESRLGQELQIELLYVWSPRVSFFLEGKGFYQRHLYAENGEEQLAWAVEREQAFVYLANLGGSGTSLQVGRQDFRDRRTWWWDTDLDAVRLYYDRRRLHAEIGAAKRIAPVSTGEVDPRDPRHDDALRWLASAAFEIDPDHRLDAFFLYLDQRRDLPLTGALVDRVWEDLGDADLLWLGSAFTGSRETRRGMFEYLLQAGWVGGEERVVELEKVKGESHRSVTGWRRLSVRGWAMDGAVSWWTTFPGRPGLSLGYAMASGGSDGADGFRQTGLQGDKARLFGVNRFRYYGELLRPELSNLMIGTVATGFRFWTASSIELVYHPYWQTRPAPFLRNASLRASPEGRRRMIGHEWSLVVGMREWERIQIEIVAAVFLAGAAFGPLEGEMAQSAVFKISYGF